MKGLITTLALLAFCAPYTTCLAAEKDQIEKTWMTAGNQSKIEMFKGDDGVYYGRIAWIRDSIDPETGKPKLDKENPDVSKRNQPLLGLVIMRGFKKRGDEYVDGKIYDPSKGRTYCARLTFKGFFLDLHGFICQLGSFFGRTERWILDKTR